MHVLLVLGHLPRQCGPRPDEAHLALQDVEQLRQLVEREPTDEPSDAGDSGIALDLEQDAAQLALQLGESLFRIHGHGTELVEVEGLPLEPHSCLLYTSDAA